MCFAVILVLEWTGMCDFWRCLFSSPFYVGEGFFSFFRCLPWGGYRVFIEILGVLLIFRTCTCFLSLPLGGLMVLLWCSFLSFNIISVISNLFLFIYAHTHTFIYSFCFQQNLRHNLNLFSLKIRNHEIFGPFPLSYSV